MEKEIENSGGRSIRCLCRKLMITNKEPGLQWLIGSPFFPSFTIVSTFRCLHTKSSTHPFTPDFAKESDDLRALLLRGFDIIGALVVKDGNWEENAIIAAEAAREIRSFLQRDDVGTPHVIGAAADLSTGEIKYFVSPGGTSKRFESIDSVVFEEFPDKYLWERGCLIKCELLLKLPIYYPIDRPSDSEDNFSSAVDAAITNLRDSKAVYVIEGSHEASEGVPQSVVLRSAKLDFKTDISEIKLSNNTTEQSDLYTISCSYFCSKNKPAPLIMSRESADAIQVSIFLSQSEKSQKSSAPIAEYFPASETAKLLVVNFKIEVLCYTAKDLPVAYAISKLVVPGLGDQLTEMKKFVMPNLQNKQPQLQPYHFCLPGVLHPVTVIYELSYGETEMKQVEIRKSLHLRLGLPLDRPLLLVANALNFSTERDVAGRTSMRHASTLLKDVHIDIPASGVSRGFVARVDGSYEYYHYLQDGINDSGWGCAYRSLQTIISWFRLQHYTSIEVPSHREIQQALVEIGDKEPYFIGSREWIGAIELSFVLDKLLGVSCKIINVRSGAELPEKCRELSLHFETQGTPVMIGGGVLAYTLLGVDYNEASGDCAFLILDPHYTGNEDLKKIVNGGWCGWKKAVDSKGKNFFLHDKFYNLLLPQRPNMV